MEQTFSEYNLILSQDLSQKAARENGVQPFESTANTDISVFSTTKSTPGSRMARQLKNIIENLRR